MAALARPAAAGSSNTGGIKTALIVFVVLTVASVAGTVVMFTQQSDLQMTAEDATKKVDSTNQAMNKLRSDVAEISHKFAGERIEDTEKLKKAIETALQPVLADEQAKSAGLSAESSLTGVVKGLYKLYASNYELLKKTESERDDLNKRLAELSATSEARAKEFAAKTEEFQQKYAELETQTQTNQQAWSQQIEELKKRLEGASASAGQQLAAERQTRHKLEQQLAQKDARFQDMAAKLARFQPTEGSAAALESPDGTVVRAVAGDGVVYIDLGKENRIIRGMPFSVYSATEGITNTEKATIEVVSVFENTSECRVTSGKSKNPIISGDLVANVVYDKSRQFNFVVAGDFDLNFDGKTDDAGGQKISEMITKWGGRVMPVVDTQVDFVVLGSAPPSPSKATEEDDAAAKVRAAEMNEAIKAFHAVENEARGLSIPVLTRTEFFHLLGMVVPAGAGEQAVSAGY